MLSQLFFFNLKFFIQNMLSFIHYNYMLSQLEKGSNCKGASDGIKIVKETIAI